MKSLCCTLQISMCNFSFFTKTFSSVKKNSLFIITLKCILHFCILSTISTDSNENNKMINKSLCDRKINECVFKARNCVFGYEVDFSVVGINWLFYDCYSWNSKCLRFSFGNNFESNWTDWMICWYLQLIDLLWFR